MKYSKIIFSTLLVIFASESLAKTEVLPLTKKRPVIGLVLSGGGARGAAHVGVLKVLEDLRVPIDIITGTSMGGIVGGLHAYGYSADELESLLVNTDWSDIFYDKPPRKHLSFRRKQDGYNFMVNLEVFYKKNKFVIPTGLVYGQKLDLFLKSLTPSAPNNFDALPVRFRVVAHDIETDEAVIIDKGSLVTAMRASMSIPGVFTPIERNGRLLVDGGLVNNLPVNLARELGAEILIVVDLSSEPSKRDKLSSPLSIIKQNLGFMLNRNIKQQLNSLTQEDILIQPNLGGFSSTDFWRSKEMIARGAAATESSLVQISQLSVSEGDYHEYLSTVRHKSIPSPRIKNIVIKNNSNLDDSVIRSFITSQPGDVLNFHVLNRDLPQIYGLNIFERVSYEVIKEDNEATLIVEAKKKDWGTNHIRFGMNLESDFDGRSAFNIATSLTVTPANRWGGEWRTELQIGNDQYLSTEFYQPIDKRLQYFFSAKADHSETHYAQYENGNQIADYKNASSTILLTAGREFGNSTQVSIGLFKGKGDTNLLIGNHPAPGSDFNIGSWYTSINYDQLDNTNLPKNGSISVATWVRSRESLGADANADSIGVNSIWAGTWNTHTVLLWGGIAGTINSDIPAEESFEVGGLFNLSGYRRHELTGRYTGVARLIYYKEIGDKKSILKIPVYIGGSLETGNAWNNKDDIKSDSLKISGSLLITFDTPIGPLYIAKGFSEGGKTVNYLFLGRTFTFF